MFQVSIQRNISLHTRNTVQRMAMRMTQEKAGRMQDGTPPITKRESVGLHPYSGHCPSTASTSRDK